MFRDTSHKLTESTAERVIESSIRESTTSQPVVTRPESSQSSKPTDDDDASQSMITVNINFAAFCSLFIDAAFHNLR